MGEAVGLLLLAALVAGLLRNQALLARAVADLRARLVPAGPPPPTRDLRGRPAAPVAGVTPDGSPVAVPTEGPGVLLAFLTSTCSPCQVFWQALAAGRRAAPLTAVVTPDPETESARRVRDLAPPGVPVVMASSVWHAYRVTGSPWFVLVREGVVVADGPAATWAELAALVGHDA